MKNSKKIIIGVVLLTSLTLFAAGTAINNSSTNSSTSNTQTVPNNGPKVNLQRIAELKDKLKNGTATKAEMAEAAEILERKGNRKDRDRKNRNDENTQQKIDPAKIEGIKTKIKNGKKLTNEESQIVLQILERKEGPRENRNKGVPAPSGNVPSSSNVKNISTVQ